MRAFVEPLLSNKRWLLLMFCLNLGFLAWWIIAPYFAPFVTREAVDAARARTLRRYRHVPSAVELVFFATFPRDHYCFGLRSAIHTGYKHLTVMGMDREYPRGKRDIWRGKVNMMRNYMSIIDQNQLVAFVDSFDSIIYATPDELIESWRRGLRRQNVTNTSILIGTEKLLFPAPWLRPEYPEKAPTPYAFINSGLYIGRASDLRVTLTMASAYDQDDDQLSWHLAMLDNPGTVTLDYHTDIVNNMWLSCDDVSLQSYPEDGHSGTPKRMRPFNKITRTFPSVLHFNGRSTGTCNMENYQRTSWWWQGAFTGELSAQEKEAVRREQRRIEEEFELWVVTSNMHITRTRFSSICPPRDYF